MNKPLIVIKLSPRDYSGLVDLGNRVVAAMTGNASFTTPTPALTALTSAITDVAAALALRGDKHSHGSTAELVDLRTKALTLHGLLFAEANYVQTTAQLTAGSDFAAMASIMSSSGFTLKGVKNPQGLLQAVRNLHRFISRSLNGNQAKLKWTKPEGLTSPGNLNCYLVYRGTTAVFSDAVQIARPTRTTFLDANTTGAPVTYYYWVVPVGAAGNGAVSDVLMVNLTAM